MGLSQGLGGFPWLCFHVQCLHQLIGEMHPTIGRIQCFIFQRNESETLILFSHPPGIYWGLLFPNFGFSPFLQFQQSWHVDAEINVGAVYGHHLAPTSPTSVLVICLFTSERTLKILKLVLLFMTAAIASEEVFMSEKPKNIQPWSSHLASKQSSLGR